MNYRDPGSELILEHLHIVAHNGTAAQTRRIVSLSLAAETFVTVGHTEVKLHDGIFHAH